MAALLSSEMDGSERDKFFVDHIDDCRRMGIEVLQPDINAGEMAFSVQEEGKVLFGLGAIKGVGTKAIEALIKGRKEGGPYRSVLDIFERTASDGRDPGERRDPRQGRSPRLPESAEEPAPRGAPQGGQGRPVDPAGQEPGATFALRLARAPSTAVAGALRPRPSACPTSPRCPTPSASPKRRRRSAST